MNATRLFSALLMISLMVFSACDPAEPKENKDQNDTMTIQDPHSFANPSEVKAKHLDLDIEVDFVNKTLSGTATWTLERQEGASQLILDTRELEINSVTDAAGNELAFELGQEKDFMGKPLKITLADETQKVVIDYKTSPGAAGLQWLEPVQTADKTDPFMFSQSQAILARTWLPCPDGPGMRFTYNANVKVPAGLMALMSAENPTETNESGEYSFKMTQPVPAYLMAIAAGKLEFQSVGEHTGVYAEPSVIEDAAYEFAEMEDMLVISEKLYGPYRWERYDLIVLPPSFPFGGMENPRLTFATPTILAGDRSLTALVAHEMAHSWSGNLVTNANWNDFWLNEGFTVYFERRIMEELEGRSYSEMLALLGKQDLDETLEELGSDNPDTRLKLSLEDRDPDDGMTDIAYEKGYFFLRNLEETVGREKFDAFLKQYFETHAFKVMTTEAFVDYLNEELLSENEEWKTKVNVEGWIYSPGIPDGCPEPVSDRFEIVDAELEKFVSGTGAKELSTEGWTTHEWLHFIRHLSEDLTAGQMEDLDAAFGFTNSGNSEIQAAWFMHVIRVKYRPGYERLEEFLTRVGRRKFLKPLYAQMAKDQETLEMAKTIYANARQNYHSVSTGTIDEILNWEGDVE